MTHIADEPEKYLRLFDREMAERREFLKEYERRKRFRFKNGISK